MQRRTEQVLMAIGAIVVAGFALLGLGVTVAAVILELDDR